MVRTTIPGCGIRLLAGAEVVEFQMRPECFDFDRKQRKTHHLAHCFLDTRLTFEMTGPDIDAIVFVEKRREERQPDHMVEVGVAEENIGISCQVCIDKRVPERPNAGASIEDQHSIAAAHFHARRIAAVADRVWPRARNAASHAPKADPHRSRHQDDPPALPRKPSGLSAYSGFGRQFSYFVCRA